MHGVGWHEVKPSSLVLGDRQGVRVEPLHLDRTEQPTMRWQIA